MTLEKFFDDITEIDLQQLIGNKIAGCRTVEYKECLPDETSDSQIDFLAEVSSFANTTGGHLLYGAREKSGVLAALPGLPGKDPECEIRRLENLLRDRIEPKCRGIMIRTVYRKSAAPLILLRIPESWAKPHVVNFQGHWRFYARNSAGKYPLGITELKSAFLTTAGLGERIRSFHLDRISKISAGEIPAPLMGKTRTVFHLIPYSALESSSSLSFAAVEDILSIPLMNASTCSYRYNLDGIIVYNEKDNGGFSEGYTQVFRNGIIESVNANLLGSSTAGLYAPGITFETDMTAFLEACLAFYRKLSVRLPAIFFASLTGVRDYKLALHRHLNTWHTNVNRIDRDSLLLPEVIVEDLKANPGTLLKPIFNTIWNSIGWERLYGYEKTVEKDLIFPSPKFTGKRVDVSQAVRAKGH